MKNLAIIPARSGSKGLKDKNIKIMNGKPLVAYTIEAAISSEMFDEVMVSTDSEVYAEIAKEYGASVPFFRSEENAADSSSSWDMVDEVLGNYRKSKREFDSFCLLQPTSPLRTHEDIKAAYSIYHEKAALAVVSVCETEHSPLWCGHLQSNHGLAGFLDREGIKQRQSLGTYYRLNGAIYIVNVKEYEKDKFLYREGSYAYIMDRYDSIDIDTETDFWIAEQLMQRRAEEKESSSL